ANTVTAAPGSKPRPGATSVAACVPVWAATAIASPAGRGRTGPGPNALSAGRRRRVAVPERRHAVVPRGELAIRREQAGHRRRAADEPHRVHDREVGDARRITDE